MKQALLGRLSAYLDTVEDAPEPPGAAAELADLYALFVELAGLRTELRTELRLVKDALEQFRGVFDTLQSSQATLQRELDRARTEARAQGQAALRKLLLDVVDLRDRLSAALAFSPPVPRPGWHHRLLRRKPAGEASWQEGLRMTLRRLDQVLLDRGVIAMKLLDRPLDPRLARVIGTRADAAAAEGTVIEEVRSGFLWDEQVLRTAEVIVSKGDAGPGDAGKGERP